VRNVWRARKDRDIHLYPCIAQVPACFLSLTTYIMLAHTGDTRTYTHTHRQRGRGGTQKTRTVSRNAKKDGDPQRVALAHGALSRGSLTQSVTKRNALEKDVGIPFDVM